MDFKIIDIALGQKKILWLIILTILSVEITLGQENLMKSRIGCKSNPDVWNGLSYKCEKEEITIPVSKNKLKVTAAGQGALSIYGWKGNEIKIKIVKEIWSKSDEGNDQMLKLLKYTYKDNQVTGSFVKDESLIVPWAVNFEIFVPFQHSMNLEAKNGAIYIDNVDGEITAKTENGSIYLNQVYGKVNASSLNGIVEARVNGQEWTGELLNISTTNGNIYFIYPENYAFQVNSSTDIGKILIKDETYKFNSYKESVNGGQNLIKLQSKNGDIIFSKAD